MASTSLWGKISDIWGRKRILMGTNAIKPHVRLWQIVVNIYISDVFSQRDRGLCFGLASFVWALADGVGSVTDGVFTT
ncbi:MFS drug transporter [Geosmithia morbida]|uniref:MFS drug transporter n=1 Tax=Geosmithia morbida TaxID=1094350 RepID=A0A9P4YRS6_9HYPO|nr:MFS drug transporter [Geosmithia morbida]KAF4121928.1 MFS drug transporter [Geosmithia morbida]